MVMKFTLFKSLKLYDRINLLMQIILLLPIIKKKNIIILSTINIHRLFVEYVAMLHSLDSLFIMEIKH